MLERTLVRFVGALHLALQLALLAACAAPPQPPRVPEVPAEIDGSAEEGDAELRAFLAKASKLPTEELHEHLSALVREVAERGSRGREMELIGFTGEIERRKDLDVRRYLEEIERLHEVVARDDCAGLSAMWRRTTEALAEGRAPQPQRPIPEWLADCFLPDQEVREIALTNGMRLPPTDGDSEIVPFALRSPWPLNAFPFDPDYNVTLVGELPAGTLRWTPVGDLLVIQGRTGKAARSADFTFRLSHAVNGSVIDVTVHWPIRLGIHGLPAYGLSVVRNPGDALATRIYASGDAGPFAWSWLPSGGAGLPAGLSLQPEIGSGGMPTGNLRFGGTVALGAASAVGRLQLEQGGATVVRDAAIYVPVHFDPAERAALEGVFELTRGEAFTLDLPNALGGDGISYSWSVSRGASRLAELGLGLVGSGNGRTLQGTVPESAPLGLDEVEFTIASSLGPAAHLTVELELGVPFSVWSQNAQLRPNNLIELSAAEVAALTAVAPSLAATVGVAEGIYDLAVDNTSADNAERTGRIVDRHTRFDIIGLQEVFDDDDLAQLSAATGGYGRFLGPPATGPSFNPFDPKLPEGSSGLVLLVRDGLTVSGHQAPTFGACNGDLVDVLAGIVTFGDLNSDCLAQKGFTLDRVAFGSDPDSYLYVVNTHLDAGGDAGDAAARSLQLAQIRAAIDALADPRHPVLIMGDLNIIGESANGSPTAEAGAMLATLGAVDLFRGQFPSAVVQPGFTFDNSLNAYAFHWSDGNGNPHRQRIDYLLVRQGSAYRIALDRTAAVPIRVQDNTPGLNPANAFDTRLCRAPGPPVHGWLIDDPSLRCYLSDHWGLEAQLRLIRR